MSPLENCVRSSQRRLWGNRWLGYLSTCLALAGLCLVAVVLVQRLWDFPIPLDIAAYVLGGVAVCASCVWTFLKRESTIEAASALDEAAGLRERLSSGHYCAGNDDPFAQAVVADAERISANISPRMHIRYSMPKSLPWTAGALALAALMLLITPGLLLTQIAEADPVDDAAVEVARLAVDKQMERVRELAERVPAVEDLLKEVGPIDEKAGGQLRRPSDVRHVAVKKLDKLEDAVKQKQKEGGYDTARQMKRRLRGLKPPNSNEAPTQQLAKALQQGDFKKAKEELMKMREQLATLKKDKDKEFAKALSKQLEDIAKQIEKLTVDKKLAEKLAQAGLKKKDVERLLENLSKKDLEQIKKQLEKNGYSQQQIKEMTEKLQQQQKTKGMASKLANALKQSSKTGSPGQTGEAMAGMSQAAGQLGEMESMEAEMAQLDSTMAELQSARNAIDSPCGQCSGSGQQGGKPCGKCQGQGSGQGQGQGGKGQGSGGTGGRGKGRGGLSPEQQTAVDFKTERAKVATGKGAIIGQVFFEGEQVKGKINSELVEVVSAAERDASDRISRDRIPRQYQKSVKAYFSSVKKITGDNADAQKKAAD